MCGAFYFWFAGLGFGANVQRRWLLISLSMMKQCKINDVGLLVWMEGSVEACSAMKMRALVLRYLKLVLRLGCIWLRGKKKLKRKF